MVRPRGRHATSAPSPAPVVRWAVGAAVVGGAVVGGSVVGGAVVGPWCPPLAATERRQVTPHEGVGGVAGQAVGHVRCPAMVVVSTVAPASQRFDPPDVNEDIAPGVTSTPSRRASHARTPVGPSTASGVGWSATKLR